MKIKLPAVERQHVGYTTHFTSDRIYFADDRPNRFGEYVRKELYEHVLIYRTAFDYDFKAAARLRAVAASALLVGLGLVMTIAIPLIGLWFIGRDLVNSIFENVSDAWDAAGYVASELMDSLRQTLGAIVNP